MDLDKEVVEKITINVKNTNTDDYVKNDWTAIQNGSELLMKLQDNGMYWSEFFSQKTKQILNIEIPDEYAHMFFANAIETAKQIAIQRQKAINISNLSQALEINGIEDSDKLRDFLSLLQAI